MVCEVESELAEHGVTDDEMNTLRSETINEIEHERAERLTTLRPTCYLYSDVHLGRGDSHRDHFFRLTEHHVKGDSLVLLGDILDFRLFASNDDDGRLVERVAAEWRELWQHLAALAKRGVTISCVPGNHDVFVFILEAVPHFSWTQRLLDRTPMLRTLYEAVRGIMFSTIGRVNYPYLPHCVRAGCCTSQCTQQCRSLHGSRSHRRAGIPVRISRYARGARRTHCLAARHDHAWKASRLRLRQRSTTAGQSGIIQRPLSSSTSRWKPFYIRATGQFML